METHESTKKKLSINLDLRLIVLLLVCVIAGMLIIWKPWSAIKSSDRTVTVSGSATITAEPDEFIFQPSYDFKNANKTTALAELTAKSEEIVKKLKELGVADSKIKTNADGYNYYNYYFDNTNNQYTYTLRPTVTLDNKDLAQKVQDYLVTTSPSGLVTPQTGFSDKKQKELESQGRDEATKDARSKADQSAKNLGFKIYKVKTVDDGGNSLSPMPYTLMNSADATGEVKTSSLSIQAGENEVVYSVTVTYYIR